MKKRERRDEERRGEARREEKRRGVYGEEWSVQSEYDS